MQRVAGEPPCRAPDDVAELRARLAEAEDTLNAIRQGEVDGLLVFDGSASACTRCGAPMRRIAR